MVQSCIQPSKSTYLQTPSTTCLQKSCISPEWMAMMLKQVLGRVPACQIFSIWLSSKTGQRSDLKCPHMNGRSACCCLLCGPEWSTIAYILGEKKVVAPEKQKLYNSEAAEYTEICESWVLEAARLTESIHLKKSQCKEWNLTLRLLHLRDCGDIWLVLVNYGKLLWPPDRERSEQVSWNTESLSL